LSFLHRPLRVLDRCQDANGALKKLTPDFGQGKRTGHPEAPAKPALEQSLTRWAAAFDDHRIQLDIPSNAAPAGVVGWTLKGRNSGAWRPDLEATGTALSLSLDGSLAYRTESGRFAHLSLCYDRLAIAEQLGLTTLVLPPASEKVRYGYSLRAFSGNPKPPGVIALTWIEAADEDEKARIRAHSRANVRDFMAEPGFISIVTGFGGLRGFTVTAWEDEAAMRRALGGHHAEAMRELFGERFVAAVWTSVWQPGRINRLWQRCKACGALEDVSDGHGACTRCGSPLGATPLYW
jgi:quinol monooxygenase YgiN